MSSEQVETQPTTEQPVATETDAAVPVELSLNDLMSLKLVLQVSTRRGCWLAEELEDVGKLYKRLSAFLERVAPQQEGGNASTSATTDAVSGTEVPSSDGEKIVI